MAPRGYSCFSSSSSVTLLQLLGLVLLLRDEAAVSGLNLRADVQRSKTKKQQNKVSVLPEPPGYYGENKQGQDCRLMPACAENMGCTCYQNQCLGGVEPLVANLAPLTEPIPTQLGCKCCHRGDRWAPGMFPAYFPRFHIATTPFFIMPLTTPPPCDPAVGCCDKPGYLDEKGYACSTWVGHKCDLAVEDFEGKDGSKYTDGGEKDLLANCELSCGLCGGPAPAPAPAPAR